MPSRRTWQTICSRLPNRIARVPAPPSKRQAVADYAGSIPAAGPIYSPRYHRSDRAACLGKSPPARTPLTSVSESLVYGRLT